MKIIALYSHDFMPLSPYVIDGLLC
jgi:hypothetical protein